VLALTVADLLVLYIRPYLLVSPVKLAQSNQSRRFVPPQLNHYQIIISKNIFAPDNVVPETLATLKAKQSNKSQEEQQIKEDMPVPSTLPLGLVGTIVHSNPEKSIANFEIKSKNTTIAVRVGNTIEKMAKLESVERGRVIIRNLNNNRLEFLELKDLNKLSFNAAKKVTEEVTKEEIREIAPNRFEVRREDVVKYTSDLSNVLQQAAMIPVRGPGGEIQGFRFVNIQPDSIYTKLGFQVGDVIKSVNGEPIDSPAKALELYNALKGSHDIKLNVERNGREQEMQYLIK
jgi:general secretion pathway protein C